MKVTTSPLAKEVEELEVDPSNTKGLRENVTAASENRCTYSDYGQRSFLIRNAYEKEKGRKN